MRTFIVSIGIEHIVILCLVLATFSLFTLAPRYQIESRNLLGSNGFSENSNTWKKSINCGKITLDFDQVLLKNPDAPCAIFLRQHLPIPQNATQLILAAEVNTHNVSRGKLSWQTARLTMVGIDKYDKKMWHHPHMIEPPLNSKGWRRVSQVFFIPPDAVELVVSLEIMQATGTLSARKIKLAKASENKWFSYTVNTLLILWSAAFVWLGMKFLRLFNSKKMQGLFLIISGTIGVGCIIPGKIQSQILDQLQKAIEQFKIFLAESYIWSGVPIEIQINFFLSPDILGHFILFVILAFVLRIGRPQDRLVPQCFNLMLFAASTEIWQFFTADRQPTFNDWLIDVSGLLLGFFLAELFRFSHPRQRNL